MMLRLVANICNDLVAMRNANAERSKSFLPCETTDLLSEPFRRTGLDLLKHSRNRNPGRFGNQHMNVIWHAANSHGVDSEISRNSSHVLPEFFLLIGRNDFAAFFRAENDVYDDVDRNAPCRPSGTGNFKLHVNPRFHAENRAFHAGLSYLAPPARREAGLQSSASGLRIVTSSFHLRDLRVRLSRRFHSRFRMT